MTKGHPKTIRFRGREEQVIDVFRVRGRTYFGLDELSRRGVFRVFDPHAGPDGDYRALHRIPSTKLTNQKIETLRRLTGPTANRNFPQIVDCTRDGSDLFVAISWVWGTNLRDYLRAVRAQEIPRPVVPEVIRLIRGLSHGISHYHRRANLIHGDISPANIILTSGTKQLVLVDFGAAWPVEQSAEKESGDGVTHPYAAPERIARHAVEDFRSDMFSLCAVAYEFLTLKVPYDGLGGQAGIPTLVDHGGAKLVPPSKRTARSRKLPARAIRLLDEYFQTGLALHPDGRFPNRDSWLEASDNLHFALKKSRGRLSQLESLAVAGIEALLDVIGRRNK